MLLRYRHLPDSQPPNFGLSDNGIVGELPWEISFLSSLVVLDLSG